MASSCLFFWNMVRAFCAIALNFQARFRIQFLCGWPRCIRQKLWQRNLLRFLGILRQDREVDRDNRRSTKAVQGKLPVVESVGLIWMFVGIKMFSINCILSRFSRPIYYVSEWVVATPCSKNPCFLFARPEPHIHTNPYNTTLHHFPHPVGYVLPGVGGTQLRLMLIVPKVKILQKSEYFTVDFAAS